MRISRFIGQNSLQTTFTLVVYMLQQLFAPKLECENLILQISRHNFDFFKKYVPSCRSA